LEILGSEYDGDQPADNHLLTMRLKPHRSLTRRNVRLLIAVFAAAGVFSSLPFVLSGAWPVAGFMGLDVALVYLAFRASFRSARAYEDICVTPIELRLAKVNAAGRRAEFLFNPIWVRLAREEHEEFGLQRLALVADGRSVEVARFLGPGEKAQCATHLSGALAKARRGPRFS